MTTDLNRADVNRASVNRTVAQQLREQDLIERVVHSFDGCPDPRLRELLTGVVRHLHAFIRDVRLTDEEWLAGIEFLTAVGHLSDGERQEFILLSDTLGASMQTITVNNSTYGDATEATVFGPFFRDGSPRIEPGGDIAFGATGEPCWVEGTVTDTDGRPVDGARIEVWEADDEGLYDVQHDDGRTAARGHLVTGADGGFRFWAVTPTPYAIPDDGPVGAMLAAAGRSPMRPAHLHVMVTAPGQRTLVTHLFPHDAGHLDTDAVFGVRDSLVLDFAQQPTGTPAPGGRVVEGTWSRVRFDIVLAPAGA